MKTYTEQDLREAFKAGKAYGAWLGQRTYTDSESNNEDEYIKHIDGIDANS